MANPDCVTTKKTLFKTATAQMTLPLLSGAAVLGLLLWPVPSAMAQQNTQARLERLENEIDTLSRAVFKGEAPPVGSRLGAGASSADTAALQVRLSDLERDLRALTGQLENQQYEMRRLRDDITKRLEDMEMLITQRGSALPSTTMEQRETFSSLPGQAGSSAIKAEPAAKTPDTGSLRADETDLPLMTRAGKEKTDEENSETATPQTQTLGTLAQKEDGTLTTATDDPVTAYQRAFTYLKDGNYENAETAFKTFLQENGGHSLAANARYWLGETYYVRGQYEQAARTFAGAYQKNPDGPKGPDNLLKLALSLEGLNKPEDACVTLQQLIKEYPKGAAPVIVRAEQEMKRLTCQ